MRHFLGFMGLSVVLIAAGCGELESETQPEPKANSTPFEARFQADDLQFLESVKRPADRPCKAQVWQKFAAVESTRVDSYGYDAQGRLNFSVGITDNGPETKRIAFFDNDLVVGMVTFDYEANAPTQYDQYTYDDESRLLKEEKFRVTIDPETLEWIPVTEPMEVIDHGYPNPNEWRYNRRGILYTLTWDEENRTLTTRQGQSVSQAFLSSAISLPEITRLGTSLSPADWTAVMDRGEYDEDGDGVVDYTVNYDYTDGRLTQVSDDLESLRFDYIYACDP